MISSCIRHVQFEGVTGGDSMAVDKKQKLMPSQRRMKKELFPAEDIPMKWISMRRVVSDEWMLL